MPAPKFSRRCAVTTISFFVIRSAPGDPFSYESNKITPAMRQHLREQFGYDRPLPEQFVRYAISIAHGEFGWSVGKGQPVASALAQAVPRTLLLAGLAPEWHGYLPSPFTEGYEESMSYGPEAVAAIAHALSR